MIYLKGLIIWFVIILAETLHGAARTLFLAPLVGDFTARQVSVFTGAVIILIIVALFVRWLHAVNIYHAIGIISAAFLRSRWQRKKFLMHATTRA